MCLLWYNNQLEKKIHFLAISETITKKANLIKEGIFNFFLKYNLVFVINIFFKWISFYKLVTSILEYSGKGSTNLKAYLCLLFLQVVKRIRTALIVCRWSEIELLHTDTTSCLNLSSKVICILLQLWFSKAGNLGAPSWITLSSWVPRAFSRFGCSDGCCSPRCVK